MSPSKQAGISSVEQLAALESWVCQEIADTVEAAGPSSVADMARLLGRRPDSLYRFTIDGNGD